MKKTDWLLSTQVSNNLVVFLLNQLYAPMSSIGGVLFDRDATYIDLGGSHHLGGGRLSSRRHVIVGANEAELAKARDLFSTAGYGLDERLEHDHRVQMFADAPLLEPFSNSADEASIAQDGSDRDGESDSDNGSEEEQTDEGLRMFEDTALPDTEGETIDGDDDSSTDQGNRLKAKAQVDSRHRNLKEAFDSA